MYGIEFVYVFSILVVLATVHKVQLSGSPPLFFDPSTAKTEYISENESPGTLVITLIATDDDGDTLTYAKISQSPATPDFTFNAGTGEMRSPSALDAETTLSFAFEFSVSDGTSTVNSPILTIAITNVNDNPPVFNQASYSATIYESVGDGAAVISVTATDADVSHTITYSITAGDATSTFSCESSSGSLTVATSGNLDAGTTPLYTLTVEVTDGTYSDSSTIAVTVTDDPCSPDPCQNSGTCARAATSFTCSCPSGWIGTTCTTDDPCSPDPCQNSGTCTLAATSFTCSCPPGWLGTTCTTGDPCLPDPCENSGTCSGSVGTYTCSCASGFSGANCTDTEAVIAEGGGLSPGQQVGIISGVLCGVYLLSASVVLILYLTKSWCFI